MLLHIDCNNFFASCERIFRPDLIGKPVVVLSNNDGCVIARSQEAKALNIQMCQPYFQIQHMEKTRALNVFSANFSLYADISRRIMSLIHSYVPSFEQYSVDECFVEMDPAQALPLARTLGQRLEKELSIPVSIGIGRTKTEAKLATELAKKGKKEPIFDLPSLQTQEKEALYRKLPTHTLWGINIKTSNRLKKHGIFSVLQLIQTPTHLLRKWAHLQVERIALELQGTSCLDLEEVVPTQKQLMYSRSFSSLITEQEELQQAVLSFSCKAAEKLRSKKLLAHMVTLFLIEKGPPHIAEAYGTSSALENPTNDSIQIAHHATRCLKSIYRDGRSYKKAAVLLSGLMPEELYTPALWEDVPVTLKQKESMRVLDKIRHRFGEKALFLGGEGIEHPWKTISSKRSPRYTTSWDEIPLVMAT